MRFIWLLMILYATHVACTDTITADYENQKDDNIPNSDMWERVFTALNKISSEMEKLSQGQMYLNQRFDELSKRLKNHESRPLRPAENDHEIRGDFNKRRHDLIETFQEIRGDLNKRHTELLETFVKRQDTQDNLLRQSFSYNQKWTTILLNNQDEEHSGRRYTFNRTWQEYRNGFRSNHNTQIFIGLDKLHELTTYDSAQELIVIITDWNGETRYAKYDLFQIGSEPENYSLKKVGVYSGDAGDSLQKGDKFSTYDKDNDDNNETNCAANFGGGWWLSGDCSMGCMPDNDYKTSDLIWSSWKGCVKSIEMKIRPTLKTNFDTDFDRSQNTASLAL